MTLEEIKNRTEFKLRLIKILGKTYDGQEVLDAVRITVHGYAMLPVKRIGSDLNGIDAVLTLDQRFEADWTVEVPAPENDLNPILSSYENSKPCLYARHVVASTIRENWLAARSKADGMTVEGYQKAWLHRRLNPEHDGHPTVITGRPS